MDRDLAASSRRIAVRALILMIPLGALALAGPWVISALMPRGPAGGAAARKDRPATDEEREASARADRKLAQLEEAAARRSTAIVPQEAQVDAAGERSRRFEGFGVSVESVPAGAWVRANGEELGTTPLVASVPCTPGARVTLEVGAAGRRSTVRTVTCREDALVEVTVRLGR